MKIEILSKSTGTLVKTDITSHCEIGVSENERKGETLNTLAFTFSPVTKEECLEPGTCIRLTYDDNTYLDFAVVSDTVKVSSKGSTPSYTHEIQCVQWARKLCYKLMRGKDFSQPYSAPRKAAVLNEVFYPITSAEDGSITSVGVYGTKYQRPLGLTRSTGFPNEYVLPGGVVSLRMYFIYMAQGVYYVHWMNNISLTAKPKLVNTSGATICEFSDMTSGNGAKHYITTEEAKKINAKIANGENIMLGIDTLPTSLFGKYTIGDADRDIYQIVVNLRYETDTYRYRYSDVLTGIAEASTMQYGVYVDGNNYTVSKELPFSITSNPAYFLTLPAPDFQFQQNTSVYDAVYEVLKTVGAKPTLDFDGNLGVLYFNERSSEINKANFIDEMRTVTDSKRTNAVVLPYQNGTPRVSIEHPISLGNTSNTPRYCHPRCKNLGIADKKDYYLTTESPIYQVKEMYAKMAYGFWVTTNILTCNDETGLTVTKGNVSFKEFDGSNKSDIDLDITDFVFDASSYNLLNEYQSSNVFEAVKQNSLRYNVGDNGVFVGDVYKYNWFAEAYTYEYCVKSALTRMMPTGADELGDTGYTTKEPLTYYSRCVYYPITSGNVRVESTIPKNYGDEKETEIVVAQKSGIVSLEKLGLSALGNVSMLGEETMTATLRAYCYTTKKPIAGMWLKDGNDYWIVQEAKSTQLIDGTYKAVLTLSKGFNKVSDRVQIDRSLRMTEISQSLVLKSEIMFRDYVYFTEGDMPLTKLKSGGLSCNCAFTQWGFNCMILGILCKQYANKTQKTAIFHQGSAKLGIIAPTACYSAGTSICFESNFSSQTSAGNCTKKQSDGTIMTTPVLYTDSSGFLKEFDFAVVDEDADEVITSPKTVKFGFSDDEPYLDNDLVTYQAGQTAHVYFDFNYDGKLFGIKKAQALKTPNDILGMIYQIFFLPYQGGKEAPIVYPGFASRCTYVSGKPWGDYLKLYVNKTDTPYSQFDTYPRGTLLDSSVYGTFNQAIYESYKLYNYTGSIVLNSGSLLKELTATTDINGWMLTDGFGKPLLASNNPKTAGSTFTIGVFASHKRL